MDQIEKSTSLRIAHITDCHLYDSPKVIATMHKIFHYLQSLKVKPAIIINTGDTVLEANFQKYKVVEERWNLWKRLIADVEIPIYNAIGNHDIWIPPILNILSNLNNPLLGKNLAMKMLNMSEAYYSFILGGWKFIGLNSTAKRYTFDDRQFNWLTQQLTDENVPVCLFSHVPILSAASFMYHLKKKRWWPFPVREMHSDTLKLQDLFSEHKNVKLCLSGHVHYVDDLLYRDVRYLCNGAVCGNWWKDGTYDFPPVLAIIDLYSNGAVDSQVININDLV